MDRKSRAQLCQPTAIDIQQLTTSDDDQRTTRVPRSVNFGSKMAPKGRGKKKQSNTPKVDDRAGLSTDEDTDGEGDIKMSSKLAAKPKQMARKRKVTLISALIPPSCDLILDGAF